MPLMYLTRSTAVLTFRRPPSTGSRLPTASGGFSRYRRESMWPARRSRAPTATANGIPADEATANGISADGADGTGRRADHRSAR